MGYMPHISCESRKLFILGRIHLLATWQEALTYNCSPKHLSFRGLQRCLGSMESLGWNMVPRT